MTKPRVLLCDDSRVYATALRRMLEYDNDIAVVAVCGTAEETIAALPGVRPDLVTMDIELPGMDGLQAVEEIMSSAPVPILVLSAHVGASGDKAAAALAAGALAAFGKDDLDLRNPAGAGGAAFRRRVKVLSRARVIRHLRFTPGARPKARSGGRDLARTAAVIGVCASTGGPQVLARLLTGLPADYPIPLLIVQHIGAGFTEGLARWLDQTAQLPVAIAKAGAPSGPGAWIAPEGSHLRFMPAGLLFLDRRSGPGQYRPSGDVLLESIATAAGRAGVAIVLSGMGSDGAAGAAAVHRAGGLAIAQDEQSSAIYGMPRAAVERGVDVILPPDEITASLLSLSYAPLARLWCGNR